MIGALGPASHAGQFLVGGNYPLQRLGYGAIRLPGDRVLGPPADHEGAIRVLRRAVDLGVNYVNSANAYGPHVSNDLIAEALHPYRDVIIGNKIGPTRDAEGSWGVNLRPEYLRQELEESLRHLKVAASELTILRGDGDLPDKSDVPWEEAVGALAAFQQDGLIRRVGISGVTLDQLRRARAIVRVDVVENRYHLLHRHSEAVLAECEADGIAFTAYQPLGQGRLMQESPALHAVAGRHGATAAQVALAWLLCRSPCIVCIPGTRSLTHLGENVAAAALASELADEDMALLNGQMADGR